MTTSSTSLTIREHIQATINGIFDHIQRNADSRRRLKADRMDYPWQRPHHCDTHHILMYWSVALAQKFKPQSELETAQCFVCDLCERDKKQKQIAERAAAPLNRIPQYRPGSLSSAAHQAAMDYQNTTIRQIAYSSIPTNDLPIDPAPPLQARKPNPARLLDARAALFADVPNVAETLILWPIENGTDEDATEMRKVCMPRKRDTAQIPAPHVEELLYRLMHVPTHEQSTDENEQLQLQQRECIE